MAIRVTAKVQCAHCGHEEEHTVEMESLTLFDQVHCCESCGERTVLDFLLEFNMDRHAVAKEAS